MIVVVWSDGAARRKTFSSTPFRWAPPSTPCWPPLMAEGITVLENVAKEPHIVDVANFLNSMGADVRGAGTDVIKIHGVRVACTAANYSIIPDQIEAGTYMVAAAVTGGNVLIKNVIPKHLEPITAKLEKAGARDRASTTIPCGCPRTGPMRAAEHQDHAPPRLPHRHAASDDRAAYAGGGHLHHHRRAFGKTVSAMWTSWPAWARTSGWTGRVAVIEGVQELLPAPMRAADLRAGAATRWWPRWRRTACPRVDRDQPHRTRLRGHSGKAAGAWRWTSGAWSSPTGLLRQAAQ